jgi:hypothetical protein
MKKKRDPVIIDVKPEELHREGPRTEAPHFSAESRPTMPQRLQEYAAQEIEEELQAIIRDAVPFVAIGVGLYFAAPIIKRAMEKK